MPTVSSDPVHVDPWPTEQPLHILAAIVSAVLWLLAAVSIIGMVYAVFLGLFFFIAHLTLVAHIRGSAVRLGPDQLPELHEMVVRLSQRIGLRRTPEAYLMQGGGALNAFATRFLSADLVVLYSDLIDACGDDTAACEMIVGHELAHVKRGHLRWHWFLLPSFLVPFLGTTLSRAREYTCDRYGMALAGDADRALVGLTILAAGGAHGRRVNRRALVQQRAALNTGLMTLAEWLSTHPPLARRLTQLDPALAAGPADRTAGTVRALAIIAACLLPFMLAGVAAGLVVPMIERAEAQRLEQADSESEYEPPPLDLALQQVRADFSTLSAFLEKERAAGRSLPEDAADLYKRWGQVKRYQWQPYDPFDGQRYGYEPEQGGSYILFSSGPDATPYTGDDIRFDSSARSGPGTPPPETGMPKGGE